MLLSSGNRCSKDTASMAHLQHHWNVNVDQRGVYLEPEAK